MPSTMSEARTDKYGVQRGSGVCAACGGAGVLRDKPWKANRETMTCPYCDGSPSARSDPDRLSDEEIKDICG